MKNITETLKNLLKNPIALIAMCVAVLMITGMVLIPWGNTAKAPIKKILAINNAKTAADMRDAAVEQLNGFCEKDAEKIVQILWKTGIFEQVQDEFDTQILYAKETYGNNYKTRAKVTDKIKLKDSEVETFKEDLEAMAESFEETAKLIEEATDEELEEIMEMLDLSQKDMKKLAKAFKSIAKSCRKARVSAGYELTYNLTIKGSIDSDTKLFNSVRVYKVNGRWIAEDALSMLLDF